MTCPGMAFFPTNFMLQTPAVDQDDHHQSSNALSPILPPCSTTTQDFHGVASFLGKRSVSFSVINACEELTNNGGGGGGGEDEYSDDGSQAGEKKRRLNMEQVKTLERNFELGNKLEPERKMQLARSLGLQPRQIAIWFQNRRARWKTKQLEKDYDALKRQFESVKAENDSLLAQNQKLHAEIMALKSRELPTESINLNKETEGSCSNRSENSSEIKLDISTRTPAIDSPLTSRVPPGRNLFPPPSIARPSTAAPSSGIAQLYHGLTRTEQPTVKEESFCNMFAGIEDQTGFWPWLEQHHFN